MEGKGFGGTRKTEKRKAGVGSVDYKKALFQAGLLDNSLDFGVGHEAAADYRISYKSIIQARQEMPLVRLQLERHMRGEEGPYTLQDTYQDITVKGKLPAHYYQQVPVCLNCFQVYSIVDAARAKAMKHLVEKADSKLQRKINGYGGDTSSISSESVTNGSEYSQEAIDILDSNFTKHQQEQLTMLNANNRKKKVGGYTNIDESAVKTTELKKHQNNPVEAANLQSALEAIDGLTKMDVAEIRTMVKPPAAVEVVVEAVMILLTGKFMTFKEAYRLLSGGEAFLVMLKEFQLSDITDERLRMVEVYVDNPLFRPENVQPISYCASKFCAWVHGIVHAARYQRGQTHQRTDTIQSVAKTMRTINNPATDPTIKSYLKPLRKPSSVSLPTSRLPVPPPIGGSPRGPGVGSAQEELSFVQKLEKIKANKMKDVSKISREDALGPLSKGNKLSNSSSLKKPLGQIQEPSITSTVESPQRDMFARSTSRFDPRPSPSLQEVSVSTMDNTTSDASDKKKLSKRELKALKAMQDKSAERLSAQTAIEGSVGVVGLPKEFRCADGLTTMPYVVMGKFSMQVEKINFIVIHDFFDTYDGTAILFKPIVQRHDEGCQVMCFNYPGQAHTTWPRPSAAERERGAKEAVLNNDWMIDRIHELLMYAEESGDILLSKPFHLVGIGNGACIAAAFAQRYGSHRLYCNSLRSIVSVNGFLYPDAQLSSILHAAYQVFEATPHSRPDIAVSYWSRFIFSEDYLRKVNPNLALNIYTAVSNPITNDGRTKITRGCLAHKDMRGGLAPDIVQKRSNEAAVAPNARFSPIQVPVVVLQSTEDLLINASNVDSFLIGRTSKHLWSHMLNVPSDALKSQAYDVNAQWVGKMCRSAEDYLKYSTLGRQGVKMLLDSLRNPRGAFVMWARTGHIVQQEYKAAFLDLMDILACPTDDYAGMDVSEDLATRSTMSSITEGGSFGVVVEDKKPLPKPLVLKLHGGTTDPDSQNDSVKDNEKEVLLGGADGANKSNLPINLDEAIENILKNAVQKRNDDSGKYGDEVNDEEFEVQPQLEDKIEELEEVCDDADNASINDQLKRLEEIVGATKNQNTDEPLEEYWNNEEVSSHKPHVKAITNGETDNSQDEKFISSHSQRSQQTWLSNVPDVATALALEAELKAKRQEYLELEEKIRQLRAADELHAFSKEEQQKALERDIREKEDKEMLKKLSSELERREKEREFAEKERRIQTQQVEEKLVQGGLVPAFDGVPLPISNSNLSPKSTATKLESISPVKELPPMHYSEPEPLPRVVTEGRDIVSKLDQMVADEKEAKKRGVMSMEDFDKIKAQMAERQLERDQKLRHLSEEELLMVQDEAATQIQRLIRGHLGRLRFARLDALRQLEREQRRRVVYIQAAARGFIGRRRYKRLRAIYLQNMKGYFSATQIQRVYRGYADRGYFRRLRRLHSAITCQRVFRGFLARKAANRERQRLALLQKKHRAAAKIQSVWRMKVAREEYRSLRIHILAAIEIQRSFRGYLGRKKMARRRLWESTKPGPERIKLGLQFIEESKQAFERQQEEIDALHRAQERAESRISHIHAELKESEKELVVLERELQEIDQIERDLNILTHERNLLSQGIEDAAGMPRIAAKGHKELVVGKESNNDNDPMLDRRRRAEAYALEMTIQLKRAEREKKRQELEIEFAAVFQEVEKKKKALQRLEMSLADMEATRERKDREFKRLQKNLMQLLLEQKQELDELREKGLELETATATTAAAAVATAQKAKEHEKRSNAMFSQTEELMKFQFMSMSLSYFSSLNMLKSLRDMNADTTSAAIALSAEASSTAAAAASAANLPSVKKLSLGANDFVEASIRKKKEELAVRFFCFQLQ